MQTNTKHNPHPRCSCRACRAGAGSKWGQAVHRRVNRKIRHGERLAMYQLLIGTTCPDGYVSTIVSTGYTD